MGSSNQSERMQILEMIQSGTITAEEGVQLLAAMEEDIRSEETERAHIPDPPVDESAAPPDEPAGVSESEVEVLEAADSVYGGLPPNMVRRKSWWRYFFWAGGGITLIGGLLMYAAVETRGAGLWLFCASLPFLLGLAVLAFSWYSRSATWLHLRIRQQPGEWPAKIAFSIPLPIRPIAWFIRTFGNWIPSLAQSGFDEMIVALGENATPENPLYIEVEDGDEDERVEIFIG